MKTVGTILAVSGFALVLAACGTPATLAPTATSAPVPTATAAPTATPVAAASPTATPVAAAPTLAPNEKLADKVSEIVGTWQIADFANVPYYIQFKANGTYVGSYNPPTTAPFDVSGTDGFAGTTFHMQDSTDGTDHSCVGFLLAFNVVVGESGSHPGYLRLMPLNDACVVHEGGQSLSRADLYSRRQWLWVER